MVTFSKYYGDSVITFDEIIELYNEDVDPEAETKPNNKAKLNDAANFYGRTVSIYCYLIKH